MVEVPNPNYDPTISMTKAAGDAGTTALTGAVVTLITTGTALAKGATLSETAILAAVGAAVTLGSAITQGIKRWRRNRKKHSVTLVETPPGVNTGLILVLMALTLTGLAGCITTALQDGSVVRQLDTVALKEAYTIAAREYERRHADKAPSADQPPVQVTVDGATVDAAAITTELQRRGINVQPLVKP